MAVFFRAIVISVMHKCMDIRPPTGIGTTHWSPNDAPSPKCHQLPIDLKLQVGLCEPVLQLQHESYL